MTYVPTFNATLSRAALDKIDAHPEQWNQRFYHDKSACGSTHCWAGWCDKLSGNWRGHERHVSQKTVDSIGLSEKDYREITYSGNSRERLENLHLLFSTGVYGVDGRDSEGFDRDGLDTAGWTRSGWRGVYACNYHD